MTKTATAAYNTLNEIIALQAQENPESVALRWNDKDTSYAALQHTIEAVASQLCTRGTSGDRVAVLSWNCAEFVELMYAVPAAGRILVPLNARLAPAEWLYQLQKSGATMLIAQTELFKTLEDSVEVPSGLSVLRMESDYQEWRTAPQRNELPTLASSDPAWLLFTSGSTGRPKGAVLTHASFLAGLDSAALGRPVLPGDKYYYPFPLFHVAAHNVMLQHAYGAAVVIARSFNAQETLAACATLQITSLSLAPTMIAMLLDAPEFSASSLDSVRTIGYGASAMPLTLLARLQQTSDVGLCQSYGMTELSGSVSFLTVEDHQHALDAAPQLLQSVGKALPGADIKVVDETGAACETNEAGEILVRAAQCFSHYWDNVQATQDAIVDGWLHTGDIGRFDAQGYLYIVDRKKDMIISGGENVASREVEEVLRRHSNIKDCAVIGLPDARWGEKLCAVIQLTAPVSDEILNRYCREYLAGYKTPRRWIRVDALPVNAGGKIDKPLLRELHSPAD